MSRAALARACFLLLTPLALLLACDSPPTSSDASSAAEPDTGPRAMGPAVFVPFFETGFERDETLGCEGMAAELRCGDDSLAHDALLFYARQGNTDWRTWPSADRRFALGVYYEAGTSDDRYARLIDDPTRPGNRVLHLWMQRATIDAGYRGHLKGRVQTNTTFDPQPSALFVQQRVYFHPDLGMLLDSAAGGDDWWRGIIFHELRAGIPGLGETQSFRMVLTLAPDPSARVFRLIVTGDQYVAGAWPNVWRAEDPSAAIPIGRWLTFEIAYRQGNDTTGRFVVVVWEEGRASPVAAIDVTGWTYSPAATTPLALSHWGGPQKLYTSDNIIDQLRSSGGAAQIYFDDFRVLDGWPDGWAPPAR